MKFSKFFSGLLVLFLPGLCLCRSCDYLRILFSWALCTQCVLEILYRSRCYCSRNHLPLILLIYFSRARRLFIFEKSLHEFQVSLSTCIISTSVIYYSISLISFLRLPIIIIGNLFALICYLFDSKSAFVSFRYLACPSVFTFPLSTCAHFLTCSLNSLSHMCLFDIVSYLLINVIYFENLKFS